MAEGVDAGDVEGTEDEGIDGSQGERIDAEAALDDNGEDETTPHVDLQLYQLTVKVSGQSDDDLDDVAATARELMDYLVDTAESLEDQPDNRGLG